MQPKTKFGGLQNMHCLVLSILGPAEWHGIQATTKKNLEAFEMWISIKIAQIRKVINRKYKGE